MQQVRNNSLEDATMSMSPEKSMHLPNSPTQKSDESASLHEEAWHMTKPKLWNYKYTRDKPT